MKCVERSLIWQSSWCGVFAVGLGWSAPAAAQQRLLGITDIPGVSVGQVTLDARPTGCTVVLFTNGAVGSVDVAGAATGTRETDLLDPRNTTRPVRRVHAVVFSGGSAFGLSVADGVVRFLEERGVGFDVGIARVPIVPQAILFDLGVGDPQVRPGPECGYRAAEIANAGPVMEGSVGAGSGATVGKLLGSRRAMKGGVGTAVRRLADGTLVGALVAVNAVGDIIDPATGQVIAGARTADGSGLMDVRRLIGDGSFGVGVRPGENTTIGVVVTDATLDKAQAYRMARMAQDGLARAIYPVHTPVDGDVVFAFGTGERSGEPNIMVLGAVAADVLAEAIVRAVRAATGLPNFPSVTDLAR